MPLTQNVCGERQRDLSCAAFRVERQGDGVILRVIGLRPRDRAKRRAQLRKLCIRFLPDNAAVLRDSLRCVPAVDKNARYAGAKGAARDQLAAPVAPLTETADGMFAAAWLEAVQPFSPLSGRADAPANATPSNDMSFARSSPPPEISSSLSDVG